MSITQRCVADEMTTTLSGSRHYTEEARHITYSDISTVTVVNRWRRQAGITTFTHLTRRVPVYYNWSKSWTIKVLGIICIYCDTMGEFNNYCMYLHENDRTDVLVRRSLKENGALSCPESVLASWSNKTIMCWRSGKTASAFVSSNYVSFLHDSGPHLSSEKESKKHNVL